MRIDLRGRRSRRRAWSAVAVAVVAALLVLALGTLVLGRPVGPALAAATFAVVVVWLGRRRRARR